MLVLTRRVGEKLLIGDGIELVVMSIKGGATKLGIAAPKDVRVMRPEAKRKTA